MRRPCWCRRVGMFSVEYSGVFIDRGSEGQMLPACILPEPARIIPTLVYSLFFFEILRRMGKIKSLSSLTSTYQIHVCQFNLDAPVATAARAAAAAATGRVSMSLTSTYQIHVVCQFSANLTQRSRCNNGSR